jgi:putative ABC transport system ATP-binding protein
LALPEGLQTRLTTGGRPLSLSQSLRLMIARVLMSRPRLVLLDGVLDYLDPSNTTALLKTLFGRSAPWTVIVITRDPAIQQMCDRRILLARMHPGLPSSVWPEDNEPDLAHADAMRNH